MTTTLAKAEGLNASASVAARGIASVPSTAYQSHVRQGTAVLDVVIPVYNEERDLERCVRRLHTYLSRNFPYPFRITIADNASTDTTLRVAAHLGAIFEEVHVA